MRSEQFERTIRLIGEESFDKINDSRVIIFGDGGVGAACAESLIRTGLGQLTLVDRDIIDVTNLNRQVHTNHKNIGQNKVDAHKEILSQINPWAEIRAVKENLNEKNIEDFKLDQMDYCVDAIDTVTSKLVLIEYCEKKGIPLISAMGAGNRMDPSKLKKADIYDTHTDPLAKVIRRECKKRGIGRLNVVFSEERPRKASIEEEGRRKSSPASISFVPPVMGYIMASSVVSYLIGGE